MHDSLIALIQQHSRPLEPIPTDTTPRLRRLPDIRAVLFDVYGTLLVSGSGDVGVGATDADRAAMAESACRAANVGTRLTGEQLVRRLHAEIRREHQRRRAEGEAYPEVEIVEIWRRVLADRVDSERVGAKTPAGIEPPESCPPESCPPESELWRQRQQLAVEYELRINPVWPMPDARACLRRLREGGLRLGIVSNAQFFTPLMWEATAGCSLDASGFDPTLQYFSYQHGFAKPGTGLYQLAAIQLAEFGLKPAQVLYLGNDLRNDIAPASRVGFRTALFAGDQRSLRWRVGDALVKGIEPDVVVNCLRQLGELLEA